MSWNSKVVWSEGMLLQPQHLQQHDRYLQAQLEARVRDLQPYGWGHARLQIDQQQLALGKLSLQAARYPCRCAQCPGGAGFAGAPTRDGRSRQRRVSR
jgi:predicted component of type VI protein secretion system